MKKLLLILTTGLLLLAATAQAGPIALTLTPSLGNTVWDLAITGKPAYATQALGGFDIVLGFNSLLAAPSVSYGLLLGNESLGEAFTTTTPGIGTIEMVELSLQSSAWLIATQPDTFTLATLTFNTAAHPVTIDSATLADECCNSIPLGGPIVPEPGTMLLMLTGLGTLRFVRWKK